MVEIEEREFGANAMVRSATVVDPWVLVVLESGKVLVYQVNTKTKEIEMHSGTAIIQVLHSYPSVLTVG